jgi:hypothetical protein
MPKEHTKQSIGDATLEQRDLRSLLELFFFQICEVGGLAIIHKRTWSNLATGQREK